jgi:hypothetical protein
MKTMISLSFDIWSTQEKVYVVENNMLISPFSLEEIHNAVFQMDPNKAPDPDDFSILFYQTFWDPH